MIPRRKLSLLCLWLCAAGSSPLVSAFHVSTLSTTAASRPTATSFHPRSRSRIIPFVSSVNVEETRVLSTPASRSRRQLRRTQPTATTLPSDDPSALTFRGQVVHCSPRPLVSAENRERLIQFFKSQQARNTLFVSDAPPIPVHPIPADLFRAWQAEAQRLGAAVPSASKESEETQSVMQLCSNGIQFSGLHVETQVLCGAKLVAGHNDDNNNELLPSYELTMIHDRTQARGPKALMWIYRQVMSLVSSKEPRQPPTKYGDKTTTSLCRIRLVELDDDASGNLGLQFESNFAVQMNFPKFLFKVLPVSKEKAEAQGSAAIRGFVEEGVLDSLARFEAAFAHYSEQQQAKEVRP